MNNHRGESSESVPVSGEDWWVKPLGEEPDEEDTRLYSINVQPEHVTKRLRELVPLLDFIDWRITELSMGRAVTESPLRDAAMNQNGTHQASVFYLIADYTLGVAMGASLPGTYTSGVHDRCHGLPIQFWLKRGSVTHLAPGTGRLRSEITLANEDVEALRQNLICKGRGEVSGLVRFYQGDQEVARAEHVMGVYADLPRTSGARANAFQLLNVKMSAMMIAGLRSDAISQRVAGDRGRALASRMLSVSPQLETLVAARTKSIMDHLSHSNEKYKQVVVLGVGLDPKPVGGFNSEVHHLIV